MRNWTAGDLDKLTQSATRLGPRGVAMRLGTRHLRSIEANCVKQIHERRAVFGESGPKERLDGVAYPIRTAGLKM
jgi:hypothetical protein